MNRIIIRTFLLALLSISYTSIFCQKIEKKQIGGFTVVEEMKKVSETYDSTIKTTISPISISKVFVIEDNNPYSHQSYKKGNYDRNIQSSKQTLYYNEVNFNKLRNDFPATKNWEKDRFDYLEVSESYGCSSNFCCINYSISQLKSFDEEALAIKSVNTFVIIDKYGNKKWYKNIPMTSGIGITSIFEDGRFILINGERFENNEKLNFCNLFDLESNKFVYSFYPNSALESQEFLVTGGYLGKGLVGTIRNPYTSKEEVKHFYVDTATKSIYVKEKDIELNREKFDGICDYYWDRKSKSIIYFKNNDKSKKPYSKTTYKLLDRW